MCLPHSVYDWLRSRKVLWMLEMYWTKAFLAIGELVGVEALFVADAEKRRNQLDLRNSNKPVEK